ncbi:RNA-binding protein hfq [Synechococcales cyanobacterium C]|uniref:RNA-binding protein hfq n=1 Tax=Petrachloros mirabilis ULC683 TaxID=2781853 RepID=A0A8K2A1I9_9CYAN|nr:RNA-binding protein hfq [Petrachloros mirabilis]NCJ07943.1 RNA-binding protein hfq [Petrachloros mirabilis ULC683]
MATDTESGLPSFRQVQGLIQDDTEVEIKVTTNDLLVGKLHWQDQQCLCLIDHYDQPTIIWKQSIVFLKPKP